MSRALARKRPLLRGSALVVLATGASAAHGQVAFQGTPTATSGSVSFGTSGNSTDVITVGSHSAIIDWTPTDNQGTGTIDFLPNGKTGIFQSTSDAGFTVLNRINPADASRPVQFDGHVVSQLVNPNTGVGTIAGNVWFYTPGGIIVGATGAFDVGSLILTTNAIDTTNGLPSPGGGIRFAGASGSLSNIIIQPGGQINATNPGSYVALVAPRINQGGTVTVNGSVGYVAAEAADITINAGLFTIANTIGSQVASGGETTLIHTGTTTGAATTTANAPHNIYMVAIPKNDAVTMLVSGSVGYQAATSASVLNGLVVLEAGEDSGRTLLGGGQASGISVAGTYTSGIRGSATGAFNLVGGSAIAIGGDLTVSAASITGTPAVSAASTTLNATTGDLTLNSLAAIAGNLTLTSAGQLNATTLTASGTLSATGGPTTTIGTATAGLDLNIGTNGSLAVSTATAGRDASFVTYDGASGASSGRGITVGSVTAGDDVVLSAFGAVAAQSVTTTGLGQDGTDSTGYGDVAGSGVFIIGEGGIQVQSISTKANISASNLAETRNGVVVGTGTGGVTFGSVMTQGSINALSSNDFIRLSNITAASISASGTAVSLSGPGNVNVNALTASSGDVSVTAGGSLTLPGSFAPVAGNLTLAAGTNLTVGDLSSTHAISLSSTHGLLTVGNITAGNTTDGGGIALAGANGITAGNLSGVDSVSATSNAGAVSLGQVTSSGGTARITAAGAITAGDVTAAGSVYLTGGAAITAGNLKAGVGTLRAGQSGGGASGGTDAAPDGIASGFNQDAVGACDDCYTSSIALPFDVNYFGNNYSNTYVSNNGYFTFNNGQSEFTPTGLGAGYSGQPIIAAFFADVDTGGTGTVTYGSGTFAGRQAFGATWNAVGYFSQRTDKVNTFQIILTNRSDTGAGNFDIYYNYGNIGWETGEASSGVNGLGGTSAAVGYNAGTGAAGSYYQLPGSLVPGSFINGGTAPLVTTTNDGNPGQLLFSVRNGLVVIGAPTEPPTVHVSNIAAGNTAAIHLGTISGEAAEVHGAGQVTVGAVTVADQHSGIAAPGNPFATVLDASGGLISGDISAAGFVALGAAQGDISTGTITSGSSVAVLGNGAISLGAITTGQGAVDTLFIAGPSSATNLTGFSYSTLLSGHSFDPATLAGATANATGGGITLGGAVSAGNVIATAGGTLSLLGDVDGGRIAFASRDFAAAGQIGSSRTTALGFTNTGDGVIQVGGGTGGYSLSAAELANVHGAQISILAPGAGGITIGDVALTNANLIGDRGSLLFNAAGNIQLTGRLAVSGIGTTNSLSLIAGQAITGVLPAAAISLTGAGGGLAGTLSLQADRIEFDAASAAQAVSAARTLGQRSDALGISDGAGSPGSYIQAAGVTFTVGSALYIQNSGIVSTANADRAGVTAGTGGIMLAGLSSGPAEVVLNARIAGANGEVTGQDVAGQLRSAGETTLTFAPESTVNGCTPDGATCAAPTVTVETVNRQIPSVQDVIEQINLPSGIGRSSGYSFQNPQLVSMVGLAPEALAPLIDEPVTGAGNDNLWVGVGVSADQPLAPLGGAKSGKAATPH